MTRPLDVNEIKDLVKDIVEKIKIQAGDVDLKISKANEYEFKVCEYLIKWTILLIPSYIGLIKLTNFHQKDYGIIYAPFFIWLFSLLFGLCHYMNYREICFRFAKEMDSIVAKNINAFHESSTVSDLQKLQQEFFKAEKKERILEGNMIYLRLQLYCFLFGAFLFIYALI